MSIPKNACVSMKWDGRLPIGFNIIQHFAEPVSQPLAGRVHMPGKLLSRSVEDQLSWQARRHSANALAKRPPMFSAGGRHR